VANSSSGGQRQLVETSTVFFPREVVQGGNLLPFDIGTGRGRSARESVMRARVIVIIAKLAELPIKRSLKGCDMGASVTDLISETSGTRRFTFWPAISGRRKSIDRACGRRQGRPKRRHGRRSL